MLRCYFLALASGSSVDQVSNNFSLFNLIEQVNITAERLGTELAVEAHIYWLVSPQAMGRQFEVRVVRIAMDGGAEDVGAAMPLQMVQVERVRFRTGAFRLPREYGTYSLAVEWRLVGGADWAREGAAWPLVVAPAQSAAAVEPAPDL